METTHNTIGEISVSYRRKKTPIGTIRSTTDSHQFFRKVWNKEMDYRESVYVVYLDTQNNIIGYTCMFTGGVNSCILDPKIVFQHALLANAVKILVAHNHPTGVTTISGSDELIKKKLVEGGRLLDLHVLDFCIITSEDFVSFADKNML